MWSHARKWQTSRLSFVMSNCEFLYFPIGILGQVWYLIVSIPDLCHLSYFYFNKTDGTRTLDSLNEGFPINNSQIKDKKRFFFSVKGSWLTPQFIRKQVFHIGQLWVTTSVSAIQHTGQLN